MKTTNHSRLTLLAALLLFLPALAQAQVAVPAWVRRYSGPGNSANNPAAMAVDGSNSVIVTGYSIDSGGSDYATIKYSSGGVALWTNRYNGPGNSSDFPRAVAVDGSNSVIVTGTSGVGGSGLDFLTIKYSGAGAPLWTNRYNGPGNDQDGATALAVDTNNNVIVTGVSFNGTNDDYATIQYSSAGAPLWTNRYNGPGNGSDQAAAVVVAGSNRVIVTGISFNGTNNDYATIQYSSAGVPLWTNRYNGPANDEDAAAAIAMDGSNNVIVTGYATASVNDPDYTTIKYSSLGAPLWTNRYNGPAEFLAFDFASAVAVDGSNNVIVTGYSMGSGGFYDYATVKYSGAGAPVWTNRYNGPANNNDNITAMAVDGSNNVIVTGYSIGSGFYDYATVKYSSAGVPLWTNRYNGPGSANDSACGVAVDRSGNVIVTGVSYNGTNNDFATVKYVLPPMVTSLGLTNGNFRLRLDDPAQAPTMVVEASTNLAAWTPVFTNTTPTNLLFYTEPNTSNNFRRFYRASDRW